MNVVKSSESILRTCLTKKNIGMKVVSSAQNAELHWLTNNSDRKLTESIVGHVTILSSRPDAMDAAMSLEQE